MRRSVKALGFHPEGLCARRYLGAFLSRAQWTALVSMRTKFGSLKSSTYPSDV